MRIGCTLLVAAIALFASAVHADDRYPQRPIRLIAPFPPGGGVDINARLLADPLGKALGQTVVVDNRAGAAGRLGLEIIAKSTPDGYTIGIGGIGMAISRALYKKLPYDTYKDFAPITLLAGQPNILVAHPSTPANTFQEFVQLVRSQPGTYKFGTPGVGSGTHLATVLLLMSQKMEMLHVPYKGTGPSLTAVLGNEITIYLSTFASALSHVKADRLRAFGVTSAQRAKPLPDVPTIAEAGIPGYEYSTWYGLVAPAGVPGRIIAQINKAAVGVLGKPEIQKLYEAQGLDPTPSTQAHYAKYLKSETEKRTKAVHIANITLD